MSDIKNLYVSTDRHEEWSGNRRYVRVMIHNTLDELRWYADQLGSGNHEDSVAVYHPPVRRFRVLRDPDETIELTDPHYAGLIRFVPEFITPEVVAHECAHAAAGIWRLDVSEKLVLEDLRTGDQAKAMMKEEMFCYLLGDLVGNLTGKLIQNNYL